MKTILFFFLVCTLTFPLGAQHREIEVAYNSGKWNENLLLIDHLIDSAISHQNHGYLGTLFLLKAKQFWAKTSHQNFTKDSCLSSLKQAQLLGKHIRLNDLEADVLQLTGQLLYRDAFENGKFDEARSFFRQALFVRQSKDSRSISESLFYIGLTFEQSENPDSASFYYNAAYNLAAQHQLKIQQSDAARHLGGLAEGNNRRAAARSRYEESLFLRQEAEYFVGIPYAMITLADHMIDEDRQKADSLYRLAALISAQSNVWRAQVNALNSLGELNNSACDIAVPLFSQAIQLSQTFNYKAGEKRANSGLAKCKNK